MAGTVSSQLMFLRKGSVRVTPAVLSIICEQNVYHNLSIWCANSPKFTDNRISHIPYISPNTIHVFPNTIHISPNTIHISPNTIHISPNTIHVFLNTIHVFLNTIHVFLNTIHISLNTIHISLNTIHVKIKVPNIIHIFHQ
jgi:predicted metal-dependent enzyme (double-stranded beta helix superfamily)